jgi:MFS family permease
VWVTFSTLSMFGVQVVGFAMGWAAAGHGPAVAGVVLTATVTPRALLLLIGGAVADRVGSWKILVLGDITMIAAVLALLLATLQFGTPATLLVAMSLVIGTVDAFYIPASGSLPRRLLPRELLPQGMSMRQMGYQLAGVLGAPVAGLIYGSFGLAGAALINILTFGAMLVVLVLVRHAVQRERSTRGQADRGSLLHDVKDGLSIVWNDSLLRPSMIMVAATTALLLPIVPLLIPIIGREENWPSSVTGLAVGAFGLGTASMALLVLVRGSMKRPGLAAAVGPIVSAIGVAGLAMPTGSVEVAVVAAIIIGVGTGLFSSHIGPLLLGGAPREFISRVQSVVALAQSLPLIAANAGMGFLAEGFGVRWVLVGVAVGLTAVGFCAMTSSTLRDVCRPQNN